MKVAIVMVSNLPPECRPGDRGKALVVESSLALSHDAPYFWKSTLTADTNHIRISPLSLGDSTNGTHPFSQARGGRHYDAQTVTLQFIVWGTLPLCDFS